MPARKKSCVIPGYQGYLPRLAVENHHIEKTITEQSREVFNPQTLDHQVNCYASTGLNSQLIPKQDKEYHATSHRFGRATQLRNAIGLAPLDLTTTTTRNAYHSPTSRPSPVWRSRETGSLFDGSPLLKVKELQSDYLASGYSSNFQQFDGTTWRTEKNLHSD